MGEKGNIADVRGTGGHVASPTQAGPRPQDVGLGGQPVSGAAPAPPPPPRPQAGGGGLLSDLADKATDKVTDVGLGGEGLGIVKGRKDHDDDDETT